jgi:hypothetical protein
LALAAICFAIAKCPTVYAFGREAVLAVGANAVAKFERRYDQVIFCNALNFGSNLLDNADELMSDTAYLVLIDPPVIP